MNAASVSPQPIATDDPRRAALATLTRLLVTELGPTPADATPPPAMPWPELLEVAARTRTLPALGYLCQRCAQSGQATHAPGWFHETAAGTHEHWQRRNTASMLALDQLLDACGHSLRLAVRKGASVGPDYYPTLGCRPFGDVDIFVHPDDAPGLYTAAERAGFRRTRLPREQRCFLHVATRTLDGLHLRVRDFDVHFDIADGILLPVLGTAGRERAMLDRVNRKSNRPTLQPVDLLLDLLGNLHATSTSLRYARVMRFQRLTSHLDCLLVARQLSLRDWDELVTRAHEYDLDDACTFGFTLIAQLFPGQLDNPVVQNFTKTNSNSCNEVGHWELRTPYRWRQNIWRRILLDELPKDFPKSRVPI